MSKILIVASFAKSFLLFRRAFIERLLQEGHEVHVAAPAMRGTPIERELIEMGVSPHEISLSRAGLNPFRDLKCVMSIYRLIRSVRPDVFYAYTIKPVVYGLIAARWAGVSRRYALITGLGYAFQSKAGLLRKTINSIARCLYRFALSSVTKVFFQNPDDRALFLEENIISDASKALVVNGSGVDLQVFQASADAEKKEIDFLFVGRLLKDKGIREYVAAAELLKQKYPELMICAAGSINENPSSITSDVLQTWKKKGDVDFLGHVNDIPGLLQRSRVFVLPSYREGVPRSSLEALAMGLPVITTDAPGCRETVINGQNGFLVPLKDASALYDAMEKLVLSPALAAKMAVAARRLAEEKFDVHVINDFLMHEMGLLKIS